MSLFDTRASHYTVDHIGATLSHAGVTYLLKCSTLNISSLHVDPFGGSRSLVSANDIT